MLPSFKSLNTVSLPRDLQAINEAYIPSIANNYTSKGLRLIDVFMLCTCDPTYDRNKPLQTGQFFKWLLLPGRAGWSSMEEIKNRVRNCCDQLAYLASTFPGDSVYKKELMALSRKGGDITDEVEAIVKEFPEQVLPTYADQCLTFRSKGHIALSMLMDRMPRIKKSGIPFDIMRFKSPDALSSWLVDFEIRAEREAVLAESVVIYDSEDWFIVHPQTKKAAEFWGKGTGWCTSNHSESYHYNNYTSKGDLVIIMRPSKNDPRQAEPFAQLFLCRNGHYSTSIGDVGTIILNASDDHFRASLLFSQLGDAADAIADFFSKQGFGSDLIEELWRRWENGAMNEFADGEDEYEDEEDEDEDDLEAHPVSIDINFHEDYDQLLDPTLSIRVRDQESYEEDFSDFTLPISAAAAPNMIPPETLAAIGLPIGYTVYVLKKKSTRQFALKDLIEDSWDTLSRGTLAGSLEAVEADDIYSELKALLSMEQICMVVLAQDRDEARDLTENIFGVGMNMINRFERAQLNLDVPNWRPLPVVSGEPRESRDVLAAADAVYQLSISFWSKIGTLLASSADKVYEFGESALAGRRLLSRHAATKAWMETPKGTPEWWIRAVGVFIDTSTESSARSGYIEPVLWKQLTEFLAAAVKTWQQQVKTAQTDFLSFLSLGPLSDDMLDDLPPYAPFDIENEYDQLLFDLITLQVNYKERPKGETLSLSLGTGSIEVGGKEVWVYYPNHQARDSAMHTSTPNLMSRLAEGEQSLRSLGIKGLAETMENNIGNSKQAQLAFSRALTRKGKRL